MINRSILKENNNFKTIIILLVMLLISLILATAIGSVYVPIEETMKIIIDKIFNLFLDNIDKTHQAIIYYVRLPRVIVTMLVGAALSISGVSIQSMFRNPMADPGVIGISSGASLGAVTAIAFGVTAYSLYLMPLFAIAGALISAGVIFKLSSRGGKVPVLTLILAGIAVSTFIRAVTSLILTSLREEQMREYVFWSIGSLSDRRWEHVTLIILPIVLCMILLLRCSRDLNILLLGEEEAQSLGLSPYKARKKILALASITTAMAVCVSGGISFVGLIVPHIIRMIVGPDNRILIPASALGGAVFLLICDLIARTVISPIEIGVGIVTSLLGAPYFLFLLNRARKDVGL